MRRLRDQAGLAHVGLVQATNTSAEAAAALLTPESQALLRNYYRSDFEMIAEMGVEI